MQKQEVTIINRLGLHARAAAKLSQLASHFSSEVFLEKTQGNAQRVNGKSIMGVMMLAAAQGHTISIETSGTDEVEALQALVKLVEDYFGESR